MDAFINEDNISIICLSETFLDLTIPVDDVRLYIKRYSIRADYHSSNTKRGGVCIYYKDKIPLIGGIDICKLNECIVTEITLKNERCFLICLYRSLSQN